MTRQEAVDYLKKLPIDTKIGNANQPMSSNLINMCMEALEKQIPKELKREGYFRVCECGCAMSTFLMRTIANYCPECGQSIKWE